MNEFLLKNGKLIYTVKNGETIYSIAEKFGLTAFIIARENELKEDVTSSMILIIPILKVKCLVIGLTEFESNSTLFDDKLFSLNKISVLYPFCRLLAP